MLLKATDPALRAQAIAQAARLLAEGNLLGLPTETVYGLGADACNDAAVARIYATKGRPAGHPLIVHVSDMAAAAHFVPEGFLQQLPDYAASLMRAFWPGPLTVIVPRREGVAAAAAGQHPTIGLRSPAHELSQAVLHAARALGVMGVAAPSANAFGRISPTTAQHVQQDFGESLSVLDGGACAVGIESTIIDCTRDVPVMLRPGAITAQDIHARLKLRVSSAGQAQGKAPCAPGTLLAHYAPRAKLRLMQARDMQAALTVLGAQAPAIAIWSRSALKSASPAVRLHAMPQDPAQAAQQLFGTLRGFDEAGAALIWVETPPEESAWAAVADRLRRAAAA